MSRVDYSKWDNIELSDDEDIECHPNIDKMSFVRMRQRQIHQERDKRKQGIEQFTKQLAWLDKYLGFLKEFPRPSSDCTTKLKELMGEFEGFPDQFRFDKFPGSSDHDWEMFRERIRVHRKVVEQERDKLVDESRKKVAVEDLCKPGFDSKTRIRKDNEPAANKVSVAKGSQEETIEVLNADAVARAAEARSKENTSKLRCEEDTYIDADSAVEFANLPPADYPKSYDYLRLNQTLISQEIADQILASAFQLQMNGKPKKATRYIHQALILQFCNNLGKDGAPMFFAKIKDKNHKATQMFYEELERTQKHIKTRTSALKAKAEGKNSGVNLEPVGDKMEVFRSLPADLQQALLTEDLEKVHDVLDKLPEFDRNKLWEQCKAAGIIEEPKPKISDQEKLDLFKSLPEDFGEALVSGDINKTNEVLASFTPEEAERVIDICKRGGFLEVTEEDEDAEEEEGEEEPAQDAPNNSEAQ